MSAIAAMASEVIGSAHDQRNLVDNVLRTCEQPILCPVRTAAGDEKNLLGDGATWTTWPIWHRRNACV